MLIGHTWAAIKQRRAERRDRIPLGRPARTRGRKHRAGSVTRISAAEIENLVEAEVRSKLNADAATLEELFGQIQSVTVLAGKIQITLRDASDNKRPIEIPWAPKPKDEAQIQFAPSETRTDPKLIKAIVRAQAWLDQLSEGHHTSIEDLAAAADYNQSYSARPQARISRSRDSGTRPTRRYAYRA